MLDRIKAGHVRAALDIAGLSLISAGATTWHPIAGLLTGGLSCLALAWRMT